MHSAPWTKCSSSTGTAAEISRISSRESSRESTTRRIPCAASSLAPAGEWTDICVEACRGKSGAQRPQQGKKPHILHNDGVHRQGAGKGGKLQRSGQFVLQQKGIHGQMDRYPAHMAVFHGLPQRVAVKVMGGGAGAECLPAQIDGCSAGADGGHQGFHGAGGARISGLVVLCGSCCIWIS